MKRAAVFFDRDNTLIACDEYLGDASKVTLIEGAADAVAQARQLGYAVVTVSNQSGVARGMFSEAAVHAVNQRLDELLAETNPKAIIDRHEFCPFHPDASIEKYRCESPLRKPAPGMLLSAAEALALDLSRSFLVGDAPRDIEAGAAAGCRTILFVDPKMKSSPAALAEKKVEPDYVCTTLREAMDFVEKNTERRTEEVKLTPSPSQGEGGGEGESTHRTRIEPTPTDTAPLAPLPSPSLPAARDPVSRGEGKRQEPPTRLESIAEQVLQEMRRRHEQPQADFSVSKLLAGVVQIIVLFVLFLAYLNHNSASLIPLMLLALVLQTMTIALLIMGRQR